MDENDNPTCTSCGHDDQDELAPGLNGDQYCAEA